MVPIYAFSEKRYRSDNGYPSDFSTSQSDGKCQTCTDTCDLGQTSSMKFLYVLTLVVAP